MRPGSRRTCRGKAPPSCLRKTVRSLKVPTGDFIVSLRFTNAILSLDVLGEGQAILPGIFQQELAELLLRNG